ncbi:hypothetical protein DLD77_01205 [Chitinophaga alhagiae]|uniref:TraB/GumN family protein n=1 Tax=Chitinophaga alhagiae TaxID=2203219 RepID=A0ABN5LM05_9BACT|nr:TraB/GumN family protein [Chitinophaga alhagiae]AWO00421.1 hypothetical protein DLD77_01205 [Chitinophaga alhagiae]
MNRLKSVASCCLALMFSTILHAQSKKYQGLLWEISGKNMPKPSYLFGTMHVSSKLAFHLSDSFYHCIRSSDIVALETDPRQLQEDFSNSKMLRLSSRYLHDMGSSGTMSPDAFTIGAYADLVRTGLTYRPEMINHLLYRSFAAQEDFEEDTFLDMYIYQVGSKLGKKAAGVENFEESERLMLESYRDAANDRKARKNVRQAENPQEARRKLNDAYRRGDLDMLDSISTDQYASPAFLEKFLYKRNENMFHAIDSIIRRGSLFAGVGAAHLPGERGLIEMLRKAGYTVRPVATTNRDSGQKETLDQLKAPVSFRRYASEDGWVEADVPGKLYNFSNLTMLNQLQYADLANGAYYLVSRIKTNALSLGQREEDVYLKVDSLLYENIPGRIISKKTIHLNGYKGFDISNRTRRGDLQRYNIFITPFEIIIFKISGNGEYVAGEEAARFFSSIRLKPFSSGSWTDYHAAAGFSVKMPHTPVTANHVALRTLSKRMEYEALDGRNGNSYLVMHKTIPDYSSLEEDTVDLSFAEESFLQSQFIKQQKSRRFISWQGYPCLELLHLNTDNSYTQTRILLRGAHYYLLSARYRNDKKPVQEFFNSFTPAQPVYRRFEQYRDTSLHFSVKTAVVPNDDEMLMEAFTGSGAGENNEHLNRVRNKVFRVDSTGEEVRVIFRKFNRYYSAKDSAGFWQNQVEDLSDRGDFVIHQQQYERLPGWESMLLQMRDTNSSRSLQYKVILRNGVQYTLYSVTDNIQGPSEFVRTFFSSFTPADTAIGASIYASKAAGLFADFYSTDSTTRQQARSSVGTPDYKDEDAPVLMGMIRGWSAAEKNYMDVKTDLIGELGRIKHPDILPFLQKAYEAANDTASLQRSILIALLRQQTTAGHALFKNLVLKEIPVFSDGENIYPLFRPLYDSLQLARALFPDLLELTALTDYKEPVYNLLSTLVDSSLVQPSLYADHVSQLAFDARIALQKELADEQNRLHRRDDDEMENEAQEANTTLHDFAVLLLPFRQQHKNAERFLARYESSGNPAQQVLLAQLYMKNNLPVSDSLLQTIAAQDRYRVSLWTALSAINQQNRFPAAYNKQELMARSLLYGAMEYNVKVDTLVLLGKKQTWYRFRKSTVYVYKYRQKDADTWYLGISGPQPEDEKKCADSDQLSQFTRIRYKTDKPLSEQITGVIRHVKYRNRSGWNGDSSFMDMTGADY